METKHTTKGDWKVRRRQGDTFNYNDHDIFANDSRIARCFGPQAEANAQLFFAAPKLLRACEAWEKAVTKGTIVAKDLGSEILVGEAIEKTMAAIALVEETK